MKSTIKFLLKIFTVTALIFGFMLVIPELFSNQKIEINAFIDIHSLFIDIKQNVLF